MCQQTKKTSNDILYLYIYNPRHNPLQATSYDPDSDRLFIHGGFNLNEALNDLWTYSFKVMIMTILMIIMIMVMIMINAALNDLLDLLLQGQPVDPAEDQRRWRWWSDWTKVSFLGGFEDFADLVLVRIRGLIRD